jgi:hypothetical protein
MTDLVPSPPPPPPPLEHAHLPPPPHIRALHKSFQKSSAADGTPLLDLSGEICEHHRQRLKLAYSIPYPRLSSLSLEEDGPQCGSTVGAERPVYTHASVPGSFAYAFLCISLLEINLPRRTKDSTVSRILAHPKGASTRASLSRSFQFRP